MPNVEEKTEPHKPKQENKRSFPRDTLPRSTETLPPVGQLQLTIRASAGTLAKIFKRSLHNYDLEETTQ